MVNPFHFWPNIGSLWKIWAVAFPYPTSVLHRDIFKIDDIISFGSCVKSTGYSDWSWISSVQSFILESFSDAFFLKVRESTTKQWFSNTHYQCLFDQIFESRLTFSVLLFIRLKFPWDQWFLQENASH